ncbi:MAG: hypothetical protein LBJ59_10860 [Zoogloeaceae bacterium]|nr:hypothetical protein [Zoogloeaceae bacterium]
MNLPTRRWNDIEAAAHDRAFVVAGAMEADLLDDLRKAVEKGILEGTDLEQFRRDFREIVERHGWRGWTGEGTKAGEAWRTRVIFETNMTASHAAGRWEQLTDPDVLEAMPYWRYVHDDGVLNPRPQHLAWDGLTLRHDHPFWQTNFPPNGWGCHCTVEAMTSPEAGDPTEPPAGWDEPDGKGRLPGVDRGFAYAPGASVSENLRRIVEEKAAKLPAQLARDFLAQAEKAGIKPAVALLSAKRAAKTEGDAKKWLVTEGKRTKTEHVVAYNAATGKEIGRYVGNDRKRVGLPLEISRLLDDRAASVVLMHNHPSSHSLSAGDLTLLARPGANKAVVHGHDRSWFAATKGANMARLEMALETAGIELDRQIYLLSQRGLGITGIEAHLRNLALNRAGIIRYEYALDSRRARLYTKERAALDAAVEEITLAIKRARS